MRQACTVVVALVLLHPPVSGFGEGAGAGKAGRLAALAARLTGGEAATALNLVRARATEADEAQALFAHAHAAVYLWDRDEVWLLTPHSLATLRERSAKLSQSRQTSRPLSALEDLGSATLGGLLERLRVEHPDLDRPGPPRFLAKLPAQRSGLPLGHSPAQEATTAAGKAVVLSEGFESNPWSTWTRWDNTNGAYQWGQTTCDRHSGSFSADAVRGGSVGSTLSCTASYADNTRTVMYTSSCLNITGAAEAWLDLYATGETEEGYDTLGIFFDDGTDHFWGYGFSGSYPGWWHLIHNLKQWWGIGDLTQVACNTFMVEFRSDSSVTPGFGARLDDVTIRTGSLPGLTCRGSATPASGPAPLTVTLTGTATGASGAASYDWFFDDGGSSSQATATYTYTSEGDYHPMFQVVDGTDVCTAGARVLVTAACVVTCSATVPGSGTAGVPVSFNASSSTSNCSAAATYSWSFGDGSTSSLEDPTHTYATAGTYSWGLVVSSGATTCTRAGTITIAGQSTTTYLVPGVAHAPGAAGTNWRTKLSVLNRSGATAQVTLNYVRTGKLLAEVVSLANGELRAWDDVAVDLFGVPGDSSGAVVVTSTRPLVVNARTYNVGVSGTFGQFLPGVAEASALQTGSTGVISMLTKNADFRTNVGFVNLGLASCTVRVTLRGPTGAAIGSQRTLIAPPQGWVQDNDIFASAGAGARDDAYATVEVLTGGCRVWGYGSVVDNATGDPTTVPLVVSSGFAR